MASRTLCRVYTRDYNARLGAEQFGINKARAGEPITWQEIEGFDTFSTPYRSRLRKEAFAAYQFEAARIIESCALHLGEKARYSVACAFEVLQDVAEWRNRYQTRVSFSRG